MLFLLFSILSSASIYILFKIIEKQHIENFPVIWINYLIAMLLGVVLTPSFKNMTSPENRGWIAGAALTGLLFIIMLYLIALSTQKSGITPTTLATRLAVVLPICLSIWMEKEPISLFKVLAFILALVSIFLIVYKPLDDRLKGMNKYFPLIIFIGAGLVDSTVKYTQSRFLPEENIEAFSTVLFAVSFLCGILWLIVRPSQFRWLLGKKAWLYGILLGLVNYGSVYFFVHVLEQNRIPGSIAFAFNHTGIVFISVLAGWLIFDEKLNLYNKIGFVLTIVAIFLLSLNSI